VGLIGERVVADHAPVTAVLGFGFEDGAPVQIVDGAAGGDDGLREGHCRRARVLEVQLLLGRRIRVWVGKVRSTNAPPNRVLENREMSAETYCSRRTATRS
jgi:hypothetical protein